MNRQRLLPIIAFATSAVVSAVLFYRFPDYDISLLGIGNHRYFAFHSAAIPVLFLVFLHSRRPLTALTWILMSVACGAGSALGVHLLIDAFQKKAVIFPIIGSLVDGTFVDDRLWLLANSLVCLVSSYIFWGRVKGAWK